jgi:hypothetical protein
VWTVSDYAQFVQERAQVDIGPVHEPSVFRDPVFIGTFAVLVIPLLWIGWKIYTSSWIGSPWIWTTFVLAVFMFATSGVLLACTVPCACLHLSLIMRCGTPCNRKWSCESQPQS